MRRGYVSWGSVLLVPVLASLGCGGDSTVSQVSGRVTVDNQPIEKGAISFYPVDGKTRTSGGDIKDGAYSVQVPVGTMLVRISMPKIVGKVKLFDTPNSRERPLIEEALPARYNQETELKLEVTPGQNQKDWELTSK